MPAAHRGIGARPSRVWLSPFVVALFLLASPLTGQVQPEEPDPARPDTLVVPIPSEDTSPDTVPTVIREAAASDSLPITFPAFPDPLAVGWAAARWEWSREDLSKMAGLTALEFLQRIPGMARFRIGGFGRPESVTALGMGGGRMRVFIDGLEMDPFVSGTFELETLPLRDIERVRIERSMTEIRVDVRTYRLDQPEAHSVVELGTGVYQTRLLRAIFSRGIGSRSTATGSFDLVSTRGMGIGEPYSHSSSVFRWTYAPRERLAIQADWRRTAIDREGSEFPRQTTRSDLMLRARSRISERLFVDAILGRTTQEDEVAAEIVDGEGSDDDAFATRHSTQLALRGGYSGEVATADLTARVRSKSDVYPLQPTLDVEGRGSLSPLPALRLEASGRIAAWSGAGAVGTRVTGTFTPLPGVAVFGTVEAGSRPVPTLRQGADPESPLEPELLAVADLAWRGGVELVRGGATIAAAAFQSRIPTVAPFGQPFDREILPVSAEAVFGGEVYGRLPLPILGDALSLEGWYSRTLDADARPYTPVDMGRVGLLLHRLYYGGQLEPTLRVEAIHRGNALVPGADQVAFDHLTPAFQTIDFTLQVRIIDVEAFLIWNNTAGNRLAIDLPGAPPATPRIVYGAEWRFRN